MPVSPMSPAAEEGRTAATLVALAQAGDTRAFEELVRRYRRRIFALALHLSRSSSDADDITQDVFLKAYRALPQFEGRSAFFTWVYRMTVNRAINARRDRERRGEDPMDDARLELAVAIDSQGNPQRAAELRQSYQRLLRALDALPPEMRTTVVLVVLQGFSHGEAAVVLKCPDGTIAWRMHEARARLSAAMASARPAKSGPLSGELQSLLDQHGLAWAYN